MSVGLHLTYKLRSKKKKMRNLCLDQVILKLPIMSDACDFIPVVWYCCSQAHFSAGTLNLIRRKKQQRKMQVPVEAGAFEPVIPPSQECSDPDGGEGK